MNHVLDNERPEEVKLLQIQRDVALAGLILSVSVSFAVLYANFGGEPKAMSETRENVAVHRKLFQEHQLLLKENQKLHVEVQAARNLLIQKSPGH